MTRPRKTMNECREVLRLSLDLKLSANAIHEVTHVSRGKVQEFVRRANELKLDWPTVRELSEKEIEDLLYSGPPPDAVPGKFSEPAWEKIDVELRRKHVTLKQLWREECNKYSDGYYSYQQFCRLYERWAGKRDLVMLQDHKAGESLFVDYAGDTVKVIDRSDGTIKLAQIFVAVMGASNKCYIEASWSQDLRSWIAAHVRALEFFQGATVFLIPDNLKSAVTQAERFDPLLNRTYRRFAEYYGCTVRPARAYRAKDKAKVEKGVQIIETRILAALRDHDFFSLEQLNATIQRLVDNVNNEPFQQLSGSRQTWFETVDLPALKPLPLAPFEFEEWITDFRVPKHYHVTVEKHKYSVPYSLVGELVDIRCTDTAIEVFNNGDRVAAHARSNAEGKKTSCEEHMPLPHAEYYGATPEKFLAEARTIGPATTQVIQSVLAAKPYPQLSFDHCYGILRYLKGKHGAGQLEAACDYANKMGAPAYRVVKEVLKAGLTNLPVQLTLRTVRTLAHANIRGPEHFKQGEN